MNSPDSPCIASVFRVYLSINNHHTESFCAHFYLNLTYQTHIWFHYADRLGLQIIWASAELHMAIICACVAGLRPLVTRYFPNILGSSWLTSDTRQPTSDLASYGKATGTFSHSRPHVSRRDSDRLELRNISGTADDNEEASSAQISTSTRLFMDGGTSVVPKVERDDSSPHEHETQV